MRRYVLDISMALLALVVVLLMAVGCGRSDNVDGRSVQTSLAEYSPLAAPGDSTIYALTAAGSSDSVLVFLRLPYNGADPDTVDILDALQNRKVFGRPEVGDNVAIVLGDAVADSTASSLADSLAEDSMFVEPQKYARARCVIVTEKLAGQWCYEVHPRLRRRMGEGPLPQRLQKMLEEKREYGMVLNLSGEMHTRGAYSRQTDEQLPVVWPRAKNYGRWALFNGRLVLSEVKRDTAGAVTVISTDTADFVRLRRDTLILRFSDGERKYYKKEEEE